MNLNKKPYLYEDVLDQEMKTESDEFMLDRETVQLISMSLNTDAMIPFLALMLMLTALLRWIWD
jgi:hypothetical protein